MKIFTPDKKLNVLITLTMLAVGATLLSTFGIPPLFFKGKNEFFGDYGSFLSGVIGSITSLVTVYLVYQTFKLQKKQLKSQKKELIETRNQLKRQQFETVFFNMLNMINIIGSEIEFTEIHPILFSVENREERHKGNRFFKYFMNQMTSVKWDAIEIRHGQDDLFLFINNKLVSFDDRFEHFMDKSFVQMGDWPRIAQRIHNWIDEHKLKNEPIFYGLVYEFYFIEYGTDLGHYFRYIYNTIKYVKKERSEMGDEHEYINLIQAQLSNYQLAVLFYSCLSKLSLNSKGEANAKELLDKYELFQNIPQSLLVYPSHQRFYPNTNFKDKYEA